MSIVLQDVSFTSTGRRIVSQVSGEFRAGKITAIVGTNGSGKTSLLNLLSGSVKPSSGSISLAGNSTRGLSKQAIAKQLAVLPQSSPRPLGMMVYDVVASGRYPHLGTWQPFAQQDEAAVVSALHKTDLWSLRHQPVDHLSGGEMQRVWLAMVLCQQTPYLLLDEPISYLDIAHQIALLEMVQQLNRAEGKTIIWVLHDLNQALQYSDDVWVMSKGQLIRHGSAEKVLDKKLLRDVFNIEAELVTVPNLVSPVLVPIGLSATANHALAVVAPEASAVVAGGTSSTVLMK